MSAFQDLMVAAGHLVIKDHNFIVVDYGDIKTGLDDNGILLEFGLGSITYLPKTRECNVYYGQTKTEIEKKLTDKTPDIEKTIIIEAIK